VADHVVSKLAGKFPGHSVVGIINGRAGTVVRHRTLQHVAGTLPIPRADHRKGVIPATTIWTDSVAATASFLGDWLDRNPGRRGTRPIVVSLGGDGTHNQVMLAAGDRSRTPWYFRVPLGSGNDAVGGDSVDSTLKTLDGELEPVWIPSVEVRTTRGTYVAFNIASLGIDAFVTMLHQRLRSKLPGNTYRIIAAGALLVYERIVDLGPLAIRTSDEDLGCRERMLIAFGVRGGLTYGDHIRILPGEENLCVLNKASLREKLRMKRLLFRGDHVGEPITMMRRTDSVTLLYDRSLYLQLDGEPCLLEPEDFPVTLSVRPRSRRVLQPVTASREEDSTSRGSLVDTIPDNTTYPGS
jgi:diacylglycerol kinase family enzyme